MEEVGRYLRCWLDCSEEGATVKMKLSRVDAGVSTTFEEDVMNDEAEGDEAACMF